MSVSFLGEFEVTMDAKGRFSLPAGFRRQLDAGEEQKGFVVSRGNGAFLNFYTKGEWEKYAKRISKLNDFNPRSQKLKRILLSGATELFLDSVGRVLIPKQLQEYAGLSKAVIFSTMGNKFEIWDKQKHTDFFKEEEDKVQEYGEELFGSGLMNPFDDENE